MSGPLVRSGRSLSRIAPGWLRRSAALRAVRNRLPGDRAAVDGAIGTVRAPRPGSVQRARSWLPLLVCVALMGGCSDEPTGPRPEATPMQPLIVPLPDGYGKVDTGHIFTCGLRSDGVIECFGRNTFGQAPANVAASTGTFVELSAGFVHGCGLRDDGVVECWGSDANGEAPAVRVAATGIFTQVDAGHFNSCAVRSDGVIECWGLDDFGESPATRTPASGAFTQVSAGSTHSCAVRDDGVVECWGLDDFGEAPATRSPLTGAFTRVSVGSFHTCALRDDGVIECWGSNGAGKAPAVRTAATGTYTAFTTGTGHTCGVRSDGVIECFGDNVFDQAPATKAPLSGSFVQVSGSQSHTCALRDDGVIECWGTEAGPGEAPPTRQALTRVPPAAFFDVPVSPVGEGEAIALGLRGAHVPGYAAATAFTYAFDCGAGYGAFAATAGVSCPTTDGPAVRAVGAKVMDEDGDTQEYTAAVAILNLPPTVESITVPGAPVALSAQPVSAAATFSDPAGAEDSPYSCTVDYGDGAGPRAGTVAGSSCAGPAQTYATTGVYPVTVHVTDQDGGTGSATATDFIVVYEPADGFVTGGGWIESPAGAYVADPSMSGKATFAFVSRYAKGKATPDGDTQFRFNTAKLFFESQQYDWLIVSQAGTAAQLKGEGLVNGESAPDGSPWRFTLWAGDGDPDTFRIRIWFENGGAEVVAYDNGFGQAIGGGAIVVHAGRKQ